MDRGELKRILDTCERLAKSRDVPAQFGEWLDEKLLIFGINMFSRESGCYLHEKHNTGLFIVSTSKVLSGSVINSSPVLFNFVNASNIFFSSNMQDEIMNLTQFISTYSSRERIIPAFIDTNPILMENEACINLHNVRGLGGTMHRFSLNGVPGKSGLTLINRRGEGGFQNMPTFSNPLAMNVIGQGILTGAILDIHVSMAIKKDMLTRFLKVLQSNMIK
ncbi:MAG: hypothetical protein ACTSUE_25095 [Promethearchaeota archaeon]